MEENPTKEKNIQQKKSAAHSNYTKTPSRRITKPASRGLKGYASDFSSENQYNDKNYVIGYEEESPMALLLFHSRPGRQPLAGLRSINPANKMFDKLLSYRSYQLMTTVDTRSSRATAGVKVHIMTMSKYVLTDPMKSMCPTFSLVS